MISMWVDTNIYINWISDRNMFGSSFQCTYQFIQYGAVHKHMQAYRVNSLDTSEMYSDFQLNSITTRESICYFCLHSDNGLLPVGISAGWRIGKPQMSVSEGSFSWSAQFFCASSCAVVEEAITPFVITEVVHFCQILEYFLLFYFHCCFLHCYIFFHKLPCRSATANLLHYTQLVRFNDCCYQRCHSVFVLFVFYVTKVAWKWER